MNIVKDNIMADAVCATVHWKHLSIYFSTAFMKFPNTKIFIRSLNIFIRLKICREYRDINNYYLVTCYHSNLLINYLNITAKWYISKKILNKKRLLWDEYIRFVKFALTGERRSIKVAVDDILQYPLSPSIFLSNL